MGSYDEGREDWVSRMRSSWLDCESGQGLREWATVAGGVIQKQILKESKVQDNLTGAITYEKVRGGIRI